jgi:hypothetical protein
MTFHIGGSSYDITLTFSFLGILFILFWLGFIPFAYYKTHSGDFYHIRRWKASLAAGLIFDGCIILPILFLFSGSLIFGVITQERSWQSIINLEFVSKAFFIILSLIFLFMPIGFLITLGIHARLTQFLSSDDFLDKIWKDPNKGQKSPLQEL